MFFPAVNVGSGRKEIFWLSGQIERLRSMMRVKILPRGYNFAKTIAPM